MRYGFTLASGLTLLLLLAVPVDGLGADADGKAYFDLGVFAYEDGDHEGAMTNFLRALAKDPDNPRYHHYLGKTYLAQGKFEAAEEHFHRAEMTRPDLPGLDYDLGLVRYRAERFEEAARRFLAAARAAPDDPRPRFYAGLSRFKGGQYEAAAESFRTAAEIAPSLEDDAAYYIGICELKSGRATQAAERFRFVLDHSDSDSLKGYADRWLNALADKKPYRVRIKAMVVYDDNVLLQSSDDPSPTDTEDLVFKGFFSLTHDLARGDRHTVGVGYSQYHTFHEDLKRNDLVAVTGRLFARYRFSPFTVGLAYTPTYYRVGGESFLFRHRITPDLYWSIRDGTVLRGAYSYSRNDYDNDAADGQSHEVTTALYQDLTPRTYVFGGIGYELNDADGAEKSYSQYAARAGTTVGLPWSVDLGVTARFTHRDYDDTEREDDKIHIATSLTRPLSIPDLDLDLSLNYTFTDNDSDVNDYRKNTVGFSLTGGF